MMKRFCNSVVILLLVVCGGSMIPYTSAAETKTIECGNDFVVLESIAIQKETFALVGFSGSPQQSVPTILEVNVDGSTQREIRREEPPVPSLFFSAASLGDDRYLVTRYTEEEGTASVAEIFTNGQVITQIDMPQNISGLFVLTDGFLLVCTDRFGECRLEKWSLNGKVLWQVNFAEPILLNDFFERDGSYFLVGKKNSDREASPKGVILKLNSGGELLWRYDSETYEEYIGVVPSEEGSFVVAGNAYDTDGKTPNTDSCAYSFIAQLNENGQEWRTDCRYGSKELPLDGYAESVVQLENGYLVVVKERRQHNAITLQLFNRKGELLKSWAEPIGALYNAHFIKLHHQEGSVTLIGNGITSKNDLKTYVTIIKPIPLNDGLPST